MPFPFAAFLLAAGSLGSGLLAQRAQRKQNEANMELSKYQFEQNKEMWKEQNAYNDPSAQMQRLQSAGLNPNLVYGSGGAKTESAPAPRYERPEARFIPLQIPEMLSYFQDFRMKQAQIRNVEEEARLKNVQYYLDVSTRPMKVDLLRSQSQDAERRRRLNATLEPYMAAIGMNQAKISGSQVTQADADALYAKYRAQWSKIGVTSGDSIIVRIIARMMAESGFDINSWMNQQR